MIRESNTTPMNVPNWVRAEEKRTGQKISPRQQSFTLEQKREAIRLVGEGRSFADAARESNTTRESVRNWVRAEERRTGQKISPRRQSFTLEQKREAIRLVGEGRNFRDVAKELNISPSSVSDWVRDEEQRTGQQISPRKQGFTLEQKREAIRIVGEGRSFADAARESSTIPMNVRNWVRDEEQRTGQQIAPRQQKLTLEQKREAVRLVGEGRSFTGVARELNIGSASVCKWVRAEEQRTGRQIAPRQHRFSLEQKREVIRSVEEGRSVADAARESNTSPANVRSWVRAEEKRTGQKISLQKHRFTSEQKREAIRLAGEGKIFADVAEELNISSSSVSGWVRAEEQRTGRQIAPRQHLFSLEQKREVILSVEDGRSVADAARELSASPMSVYNWVRAEEQRTGQKISLRKHRFTLEQKREVVRSVEDGRSFADVARELNTSPVNVRSWVRAEEQRTGQKISLRKHCFTLEQKREAILLVGEGRSFSDAARESNTTRESVRKWVRVEEQKNWAEDCTSTTKLYFRAKERGHSVSRRR